MNYRVITLMIASSLFAKGLSFSVDVWNDWNGLNVWNLEL